QRQRTAQGGTSAEYDHVATSGWYLIVKKHRTHARRRSWYRSGITDRKAPEIGWMEAVGVLSGIHAQQRTAEIQRGRQRMLNQEGVNSVVCVEPVDGRMKFVLCSACWEVDVLGPKPGVRAGVMFFADVTSAHRIVTDQNRSEPGNDTARA